MPSRDVLLAVACIAHRSNGRAHLSLPLPLPLYPAAPLEDKRASADKDVMDQSLETILLLLSRSRTRHPAAAARRRSRTRPSRCAGPPLR